MKRGGEEEGKGEGSWKVVELMGSGWFDIMELGERREEWGDPEAICSELRCNLQLLRCNLQLLRGNRQLPGCN